MILNFKFEQKVKFVKVCKQTMLKKYVLLFIGMPFRATLWQHAFFT
jgi:hypothetical protein